MPTVLQYALDPKGTSEDNRVSGEIHTLGIARKIRAIAPLKGAFFTNTMKIKKVDTEEFLVQGLDFIYVEFYQSLSIKYNREIAGIVLITNESVEGDVELSYQVLGDHFTLPATTLAGYINSKDERVFDVPDWAMLHRPAFFIPSPFIHQLGTNYGFEYVTYALERIRSTVMNADVAAYDYILNYIQEFSNKVVDLVDDQINNKMKAELNRYAKQFTKELAKLGKLVNLPAATEEEGRYYASKNWKYKQQSDNKYLITSALMGFKEALYNYFVPTDITGLGRYKGIAATPVMTTMLNMTNGARYVFDSLENIQLTKIPHDLRVYPDPTVSDAKWVVHKLLNNEANRGGLFAAYSLKSAEYYTGILSISNLNVSTISWLKHVTQKDANDYIQKLVEHMDDLGNPHEDVKFHVGLGEVENLPVVTREDVLCRKPVRKYVTYDALLLFWKLFLKDVKTLDDEPDEDDELDVAERFRLIFAPCGPCGTQPYVPTTPNVVTVPQVEPRDKLLAVWCTKYDKYGRFSDGFGGSYEKLVEAKSVDCRYQRDGNYKERGSLLSSYCEGTTLFGRYADGNGSFYIALLSEDSPDCGGVSSSSYTLIEIRDRDNQLFGYGYITTTAPGDPDATVMLTDQDGEGICYIFPNPKPTTVHGHEATVELRDANDAVIGYAIKP